VNSSFRKRLLSLATQKFISDIANDALQYCKIRQANNKKEKRLVLSVEDLAQSSKEYGINIKKPGKSTLVYTTSLPYLLQIDTHIEYYTDRTAAQASITNDQ
jgi:hypothetical protein